MEPLEEKIDINKLISADGKIEFPLLFERICSKEPLSVLDLGANVPIKSYILYHNYDCNKFVSVDKNSEIESVNYLKDNSTGEAKKNSLNAESFYDLYEGLIHLDSENINSKLSSKEAHDDIFLQNYFNTEIEEYFKSAQDKFDLIIASSILHFFPFSDIEDILKNIQQRLGTGGIVFFRIQNKEMHGYSFNYNSLIKFKQSVTELFGGGTWFDTPLNPNPSDWHASTYCNIHIA
jgi:SAM-dependent methyltransferase